MNKRAANKIRNEQEILNTAIKLFIEKGDEATKIGDIVAETSLAFGTFYNYFRNKSEIWDKIIEGLILTLDYKERLQATSIYEFIYNSIYPIIKAVNCSPYRELIIKNPSSFREAYFRNEKLDINLAVFEKDMRVSPLFENLPEHYYKMTVYSVLGTCFEILIQSYMRGDNFTIDQIVGYIATIFERSLTEFDETFKN